MEGASWQLVGRSWRAGRYPGDYVIKVIGHRVMGQLTSGQSIGCILVMILLQDHHKLSTTTSKLKHYWVQNLQWVWVPCGPQRCCYATIYNSKWQKSPKQGRSHIDPVDQDIFFDSSFLYTPQEERKVVPNIDNTWGKDNGVNLKKTLDLTQKHIFSVYSKKSITIVPQCLEMKRTLQTCIRQRKPIKGKEKKSNYVIVNLKCI